ncbi:MAG: hypothetical protein NVS2B3_05100 [Vulcanimicrobiaceae bacterium]
MATLTTPLMRERFPTLAGATDLVSHSMGAPPLAAREALEAYRTPYAPGSVSLAPDVSLAPAIVASALECTPECDEIVVEASHFPTVGYVFPYDVRALDLDVVDGGSHQWLCGGPGCGFLTDHADIDTLFAAVDELRRSC